MIRCSFNGRLEEWGGETESNDKITLWVCGSVLVEHLLPHAEMVRPCGRMGPERLPIHVLLDGWRVNDQEDGQEGFGLMQCWMM